MKRIENFMLPEHTNSLYENEGISSIGLTRDVAEKINELVNAYNELYEQDLEWKQTQEGTIRKGVLYMKDNLLNSLNELMVLFRDSGFIDKRLEYHVDSLRSQFNMAMSGLTVDSEVIDGRVGASGEQYMTIGNAIRGQVKNMCYTVKTVITNENYSDKLPDVDLIDEPCSYQLNFTYGSEDITANLPYTVFKSNVDELITFKDHYYRQLLIGNNYMYTRYGIKTSSGITYYGWYCLYNKEETDKKYSSFYTSKGIVTNADYQLILPDANKIFANSIYQLNFGYGSTDITENLPYQAFTGRIDELITFADKYYRQLLISDKYIYTRNGILNATRDSVDYSDWILIWSPQTGNEKTLIVDVNGGGDYKSLTECVFDNLGSKNTIYVKPGIYNLINEFQSYFGSNVFSGSTLSHHGVYVQDGTKIIMDSGTEIQFLYDGSNSAVEEYFSPFIMKNDGGEIHGGKITCTNCRYAIHDDVYDSSQNSKSVISGVYMHYTGSRNVGVGGGFGQSSNITIENCVIINGSNTVGYGIFYHNAATGNSKSYVSIKNNYVKDKIVIEPYGTSTNMSQAIVSNNKCHSVEKVMGGSIDNIALYEFNNVKG